MHQNQAQATGRNGNNQLVVAQGKVASHWKKSACDNRIVPNLSKVNSEDISAL